MPKATFASESVQLAIMNHPFLVKIHSKEKKTIILEIKVYLVKFECVKRF